METISFGEDKPRAQGSTEEAWAQNRRVEIVYDGE
jgi:peptidoglycan-associated lipoprotein